MTAPASTAEVIQSGVLHRSVSSLPIEKIRRDGATQPREFVNTTIVAEYTADLMNGAKFPPVDVFYDGETYWLVDGFHRVQAHLRCGHDSIEAVVHQGTMRDAQWFSFTANASHGARRTNRDKQRAVQAALRHPKSKGLSDREIARHIGVSNRMVSNYRQELSVKGSQIEHPTTRTATRNGKTYQMDTSNIGNAVESDAAKMFGVSVRELRQARKVLDSGHKGLIAAVESGNLDVGKAAKLASKSPAAIDEALTTHRMDTSTMGKRADSRSSESIEGKAARLAGFTSLAEARTVAKVVDDGVQELVDAMDSGKVSIGQAGALSLLPEGEQQAAVKSFTGGKRHQIRENAAKRRLVEALSYVHGLCRGLPELDVELVRGACDEEEIAVWAKMATACAKEFRALAKRLHGASP